jgi:hypothetical protein
MRKAVIAVGKHYVGKSKTINKYVKPKLGVGAKGHIFTYKGQSGFILSQTFEEAEREIEATVHKYSGYDLLILAARAPGENPSCLNELIETLEQADYQVSTVDIVKAPNEDYYEGKADEIISNLDQVTGIAYSAAGA